MKTTLSLLRHFDARLTHLLASITTRRSWASLMRACSFAGDGYAYVVVFVLMTLLWPRVSVRLLPLAVAAFAVEVGVQILVKRATRRPRPFRVLPRLTARVKPPADCSFPSGHTAGAFVMAGILSRAFPAAAAPAYLLAVLIGISRVANGVHYPSDVLGGAALGFLCVRCAALLVGAV